MSNNISFGSITNAISGNIAAHLLYVAIIRAVAAVHPEDHGDMGGEVSFRDVELEDDLGFIDVTFHYEAGDVQPKIAVTRLAIGATETVEAIDAFEVIAANIIHADKMVMVTDEGIESALESLSGDAEEGGCMCDECAVEEAEEAQPESAAAVFERISKMLGERAVQAEPIKVGMNSRGEVTDDGREVIAAAVSAILGAALAAGLSQNRPN